VAVYRHRPAEINTLPRADYWSPVRSHSATPYHRRAAPRVSPAGVTAAQRRRSWEHITRPGLLCSRSPVGLFFLLASKITRLSVDGRSDSHPHPGPEKRTAPRHTGWRWLSKILAPGERLRKGLSATPPRNAITQIPLMRSLAGRGPMYHRANGAPPPKKPSRAANRLDKGARDPLPTPCTPRPYPRRRGWPVAAQPTWPCWPVAGHNPAEALIRSPRRSQRGGARRTLRHPRRVLRLRIDPNGGAHFRAGQSARCAGLPAVTRLRNSARNPQNGGQYCIVGRSRTGLADRPERIRSHPHRAWTTGHRTRIWAKTPYGTGTGVGRKSAVGCGGRTEVWRPEEPPGRLLGRPKNSTRAGAAGAPSDGFCRSTAAVESVGRRRTRQRGFSQDFRSNSSTPFDPRIPQANSFWPQWAEHSRPKAATQGAAPNMEHLVGRCAAYEHPAALTKKFATPARDCFVGGACRARSAPTPPTWTPQNRKIRTTLDQRSPSRVGSAY